MIDSRERLAEYNEADLYANGLDSWRAIYRVRRRVVWYIRVLRRLEYLERAPSVPLRRIRVTVEKMRLMRLGEALGFDIPRGVFGPGLSIAHHGSIAVNIGCRVGAYCRLDAQTTLGDVRGGAPVLGDNVYVGSGARVLGSIEIGDGVAIGANAVVVDSFPPGVTVAGVPARIISRHGSTGVLESPPLAPGLVPGPAKGPR